MSGSEKQITWADRVAAISALLGREPTTTELLAEAIKHTMTTNEREAQKQSFARAMLPAGDPNAATREVERVSALLDIGLRLAKENARLKEALKPFAEAEEHGAIGLNLGHVRRARAALEGK